MNLRPATPTDLAGLLLLEQMFDTDRMSRRSWCAALHNPRALIIVADAPPLSLNTGPLLGNALAFRRKNSSSLRLYSLAVSPQARGLGLGSQLLTSLHQQAQQQGLQAVVLEVRPDNTAALGLYARLGYQQFGHYLGFYQDGSDALRLRKRLA